jgi:hypothetical protein
MVIQPIKQLYAISCPLLLGAVMLTGCQREESPSKQQDLPPIDAISTYLDGFHFYNGDMDQQVEAHHYVTILNEDVMQALIYDGNREDARLIGVEYIISERLFDTLSVEEKLLWHSHAYEVKSGTLIAPGVPATAERELMNRLVSTYGKTWHTWHTDRDKALPTGVPALMMAFTADGQIDQQLLRDRDARFDVDTAEIAAHRADIPAPAIDPHADAWQTGVIITLEPVVRDE